MPAVGRKHSPNRSPPARSGKRPLRQQCADKITGALFTVVYAAGLHKAHMPAVGGNFQM